MNNKIRLTESDLSHLVLESVKKIIEGTDYIGMNPRIFDRMQSLKDMMGADELLDAITGKIEERRLDEILSDIEGDINSGLEEDEPDFERPEE